MAGDEHDPAFPALFTREALLASPWYARRIELQQRLDIRQAQARIAALESFLSCDSHQAEALRLGLPVRLEEARACLVQDSSTSGRERLVGTVVAAPSLHREP